ncbi:MAG: alpha/beta hydrolase [Cellulophaga sp.]
MKQFLLLLVFCASFSVFGQQLRLKKGIIVDSIKVHDSKEETFAVYLPRNFDTSKKWPVLFVFDLQGRGRQVLGVFKEAAEKEGYILAASNNVNDSLSISQNIVLTSSLINRVSNIFPLQRERMYTAGFSSGAKLASVIPVFIKGIKGVISCGSGIHNTDLLSNKNPFHYIGIIGDADFNYNSMLLNRKVLNKLKFPNQIFVFKGRHQWPTNEYLERALRNFTLAAMAKEIIPKDSIYIRNSFETSLKQVNTKISQNKFMQADQLFANVISIYRNHLDVDSLRDRKKTLKKLKPFKVEKRNWQSIRFKESLIREDYNYYLEEDLHTYNFNNLGWWNYQMEKLKGYQTGVNEGEKSMGMRLSGYVNALIEDSLDVLLAEKVKDEEGLSFLWMLKTITAPKEFGNYLKIISDSAKHEDYGTALFYLEELLKRGYTNKKELYALEHTALFRIAPEFNETVAKYLKEARYDVEVKEE